jgi:hypothetical protein
MVFISNTEQVYYHQREQVLGLADIGAMHTYDFVSVCQFPANLLSLLQVYEHVRSHVAIVVTVIRLALARSISPGSTSEPSARRCSRLLSCKR